MKALFYVFTSILVLAASFNIVSPLFSDIIIKNYDNLLLLDAGLFLDIGNDGAHFEYYKTVFRLFEEGRIQKEEAYRRCRQAIDETRRLNPYKLSYLFAAGNLDLWKGRYGSASLIFRDAFLQEPNNYRVCLAYSYALLLQAINESDQDKKEKLLKKGFIYYNMGRSSRGSGLGSIMKNTDNLETFKSILKKEGIKIY